MASITETHTVEWDVSATPKVSLASTDGVTLATATLHENIRRSLGGRGSITHAGAIDFGGVTDGVTNYLNADDGFVNIGDTDTRFIWVRHTGFLYISATALGAVTAELLLIYADSEHIAS